MIFYTYLFKTNIRNSFIRNCRLYVHFSSIFTYYSTIHTIGHNKNSLSVVSSLSSSQVKRFYISDITTIDNINNIKLLIQKGKSHAETYDTAFLQT